MTYLIKKFKKIKKSKNQKNITQLLYFIFKSTLIPNVKLIPVAGRTAQASNLRLTPLRPNPLVPPGPNVKPIPVAGKTAQASNLRLIPFALIHLFPLALM